MINKRYLYKVILDVDDKSTVIHSNNTYPNDLETQLYKMEPKIFRLLTKAFFPSMSTCITHKKFS